MLTPILSISPLQSSEQESRENESLLEGLPSDLARVQVVSMRGIALLYALLAI